MLSIDSIGIKGYKQQHLKECKFIWENMVPKSGQADNIQGELLREAEKLRNEACDNGNINWDSNFSWFCDNIYGTLSGSGIFDEEKCEILRKALTYIKENGEYAYRYNQGLISDEECDPARLAYTDDDLYDYIEDAIAEYYIANKEPVPYEAKELY